MTDLDRVMIVFQTGVIVVCCGSDKTFVIGVALCAVGVFGAWYYEKP